jgi:glycosyltransferase involved in cell wall biosynthesis
MTAVNDLGTVRSRPGEAATVTSSGEHDVAGLLALSWERHRRMDEMCRALRVRLVVLESRHRRVWRYLHLAARTWRELRRSRPRVLLVQNPSIVLAAVATLWRPWFRYRLVVDAHNEAVRPHIFDVAPIRFVSRWLLRTADLTIVTNAALADAVTRTGGHPMVLQDRVPEVEPTPAPALAGGPFRVAVISTFAPDEPLTEIFDAARGCSADFQFFVTGRSERAPRALVERQPENLHLTGFLKEADYWQLLRSVHVVLDLTAMPDCLVCGSYEAIGVGRPLVLTDIPAGRALFGAAACFARNEPESIRAALHDLHSGYPGYVASVASTRSSMSQLWNASADALMARIRSWCLSDRRFSSVDG